MPDEKILPCLFCRIIRKEIPAEILYEDDHAMAFLDIMPRVAGHTVVIPKTHAPTIVELPDEEIGLLFLAVKRLEEKITAALHPDGITLGANQGRASGQEIDHLHIHLMPRWRNDGGRAVQSLVAAPPSEPLAQIAQKIRQA